MGSAAPRSLLLLLLLLLGVERPRGAELTFELLDSTKQCFHEELEQGVRFSLDYQVGSRSALCKCRPAAGPPRAPDSGAPPLLSWGVGCLPCGAGTTLSYFAS